MTATALPIIQSCDGCGACCMYDYDKRNGDLEWVALPRELALECRQGAVDGRGGKQLPCIWLDSDTRKCKHYGKRPDICRDFDMGSEACIEHRVRGGHKLISAVLNNSRTWHVETVDCRAGLRSLPDGCIQCCATSPEYTAMGRRRVRDDAPLLNGSHGYGLWPGVWPARPEA